MPVGGLEAVYSVDRLTGEERGAGHGCLVLNSISASASPSTGVLSFCLRPAFLTISIYSSTYYIPV